MDEAYRRLWKLLKTYPETRVIVARKRDEETIRVLEERIRALQAAIITIQEREPLPLNMKTVRNAAQLRQELQWSEELTISVYEHARRECRLQIVTDRVGRMAKLLQQASGVVFS